MRMSVTLTLAFAAFVGARVLGVRLGVRLDRFFVGLWALPRCRRAGSGLRGLACRSRGCSTGSCFFILRWVVLCPPRMRVAAIRIAVVAVMTPRSKERVILKPSNKMTPEGIRWIVEVVNMSHVSQVVNENLDEL